MLKTASISFFSRACRAFSVSPRVAVTSAQCRRRRESACRAAPNRCRRRRQSFRTFQIGDRLNVGLGMSVDKHEAETETRDVANASLRPPFKLARPVMRFFDRFRGAGAERSASVIDRDHIARSALRRQRDQREIGRVLIHQIREVKHVHVHTAVEAGSVNRITSFGAQCRGRRNTDSRTR